MVPIWAAKRASVIASVKSTLFQKVQSKLAESRTNLLNELREAKGLDDLSVSSDFKDQWNAVKELGIAEDVLNRFIQEELLTESSDCDCCSEDKLNLEILKNSGLFLEEGGKFILSLKDDLPNEVKNKLLSNLDEYLHFDFIEKLRYEQCIKRFLLGIDESNI